MQNTIWRLGAGLRSKIPFFAFFASSSIIFAGSFLVNVLNYVFTLLMGRILNVEAFGEVAALMSLFVVIAVPSATLSVLMTREVSARMHAGADTVRDLFFLLRKHVFAASIVFWMLFLAAVPFISSFLRVPLLPLLLFSILIPLSTMGALQSGALQGMQEFFVISKQNVLGAVLKLGVSLALVLAGFSVVGVVLALVASQCATVWYGARATKKRMAPKSRSLSGASLHIADMTGVFFAILATTLLLTLLSNIDVLLAKHFLAPTEAGQYGALSTLGKIIVYGVGAFTTVLLPMVSSAHARGTNDGERILFLSVGVVALASAGIAGAFALFPLFFVKVLFGARYIAIAPSLGMMALAMGLIAVVTTMVNYFIAVRDTSFMYALAGGIFLEVVLLSSFHSSVASITSSLAVASFILLSLLFTYYWFKKKRYA